MFRRESKYKKAKEKFINSLTWDLRYYNESIRCFYNIIESYGSYYEFPDEVDNKIVEAVRRELCNFDSKVGRFSYARHLAMHSDVIFLRYTSPKKAQRTYDKKQQEYKEVIEEIMNK